MKRLQAGALTEYHQAVAHAWSKLGYEPFRHPDGLQALWDELFSVPPSGSLIDRETWGEGVFQGLRKASSDLDKGAVLPPKKGIRLQHSIVKGDADKIINSILRSGMKVNPGGAGSSSEDPDALFFVGTDDRHSRWASFVVVDIPPRWEGWSGEDVGVTVSDRGVLPEFGIGSVVSVHHPIPPKFVVAVNGLPTAAYKQPIRKGVPPVERSLRSNLIRLAHARPELREKILPMLREGKGKAAPPLRLLTDPDIQRLVTKLVGTVMKKSEMHYWSEGLTGSRAEAAATFDTEEFFEDLATSWNRM